MNGEWFVFGVPVIALLFSLAGKVGIGRYNRYTHKEPEDF